MELIYFLFFPKVNAIKIGISKNFQGRLSQLEGEWGSIDKENSYYSEVKNPIKYEKLIHLFFKDFKKEMPYGDGYTEFFEPEVLDIIQNIDFFPMKLSNINELNILKDKYVKNVKKENNHNKTLIVKYHNDLNKICLTKLSLIDQDILFSILSYMNNQNNNSIKLDIRWLKTIVNFKTRGLTAWKNQLNKTNSVLRELNYNWEESLFSLFELNFIENSLKVTLSEHWEYILNSLDSNFTRYDLPEFLSIRSIYSKNMYRLLKQWRSIGYRKFSLEEIKNQLDIPETYNSSSIQDRVIKQIKKDLPNYFNNFEVTTLRSPYQGRKVIGYEFKWTPEQREVFDENKYKSTTSELLENISKVDGIEKADLSYIQTGKFPEDTKYKFTYMQDGSPCLAIVSMKSFRRFHLLNYFVVDVFGNLYHRTNDELCNVDTLIGKIELSNKMMEELAPRDKQFREHKKKEEQETKDLWAEMGIYD